MAAGWGVGNPALRESAPRSGAGDWPRVAMVAGAAFTGTHCSSCGGGRAGGGVCVLVVRIVHVRSGSCLQVSLKGAKDRQKTGMVRICVRFLCTILGICTRGSDLDATLLAPISEWRRRHAKNRCVVHCACVLFFSGDVPRSARLSLWRIHVLSYREYHL